MKKTKLTFIIICSLLLCVVIFREIGVVDVNLYKSVMSTSQSSSKSQTNTSQEENFSYQLDIKYNNETLHSHTHTYGNLPKIEIEAVLREPVYSGNYTLPLAKQFSMTYQCEFTTIKSTGGHTVNGKIEGKVTATIRGICSRQKAKELAFEEAKKKIWSYFQDQL